MHAVRTNLLSLYTTGGGEKSRGMVEYEQVTVETEEYQEIEISKYTDQ